MGDVQVRCPKCGKWVMLGMVGCGEGCGYSFVQEVKKEEKGKGRKKHEKHK